tara:strand:- start:5933 stop:6646 length:714 start_codon:yes stop_codon:yes gene_type:complete
MEAQIRDLENSLATYRSGNLSSKDRARITKISKRLDELRGVNRTTNLDVVERQNPIAVARSKMRAEGGLGGIEVPRQSDEARRTTTSETPKRREIKATERKLARSTHDVARIPQPSPDLRFKIINGEASQFPNPVASIDAAQSLFPPPDLEPISIKEKTSKQEKTEVEKINLSDIPFNEITGGQAKKINIKSKELAHSFLGFTRHKLEYLGKNLNKDEHKKKGKSLVVGNVNDDLAE